MLGQIVLFRPALDARGLQDFGIKIPLLDDRAQKVAGSLRETFGEKHFFEDSSKIILDKEDYLSVHTEEFTSKFFSENPDSLLHQAYELLDAEGKYYRYSPEKAKHPLSVLRDQVIAEVQGTFDASLLAVENGLCFFLGGGMHHGMPDKPKGFCPVNDIVIALKSLKQRGKINSAWVIDVDAHKGDGTAYLSRDLDWLQTLSIHMKSGWPLDGSVDDERSLCQSTIDIPVESGEEAQYLERLENGLKKLSENFERPDLVIVVDGADPYEHDVLHSTRKMKLSASELLERDKLVYQYFKSYDVSQCWIMAGGYGPRAYEIYENFIHWLIKNP